MSDDRGQLTLSVVEATIGGLLVLAVVAGFGVGLDDGRDAGVRLDRHAADALEILSQQSGGRPGDSRLATFAARSSTALERERADIRRRVGRTLPAAVLFRLRTPAGTVGHPKPRGATVGRASVPTPHGTVTLEVWFA